MACFDTSSEAPQALLPVPRRQGRWRGVALRLMKVVLERCPARERYLVDKLSFAAVMAGMAPAAGLLRLAVLGRGFRRLTV